MLMTYSVMNERAGKQSSVFIPTVYEQPAVAPWEYHVLVVDTHEQELPTAEQLNALGKDGWLMAGILDERATGKGACVFYYFMRQPNE